MTRRKDGLWQEAVTVKGKRKFFYGKTKADVLRKIRDFEESSALGPLFSTIADDWQEEHAAVSAYKTMESYVAPLRRMVDEFGTERVSAISAADIQAFILRLSKQGFARRTVQMHLDVLRMVFDQAIISGHISTNPCAAVSLPRGLAVTSRELPSEEDIQKVIASVDLPFGLFAYLLLFTGLRRGEALALTYEDIEDGCLRVNKAVAFESNRPVLKETKTAAGNRVVVLPDVLKERLGSGSGYIFNTDGELITKSAFRKRWDKYVNLAGISCTAHQLRHAYATFLYDAGIDEKSAQELLGHSSIVVTRNIYTHIRQSRRAETADALNSFFANKM